MRPFAPRRLWSLSALARLSGRARCAVFTQLTLSLAIAAPSVMSVKSLHAQPATARAPKTQSFPSRVVVARVADSLAKAFLAAKNAPSVAVAVVRGGDTLVMRAWGKADLEQDVDADAQTVYRIGSVTKQFTSATVMQLFEKGAFRLDDSIATYLPTLPAAWHAVTIRQLLNHTSGIPSYTDVGMSWVRRWGEAMTPDTLVALTANKPLNFPSGTKWEYNNTGYVILGMLIEKLTGHAWGDEIETRFAKPLGLTSTRNCLASPVIPHRAHGYERESSAWINAPYLEMTQPYAAGAMCSTIGDLATWNRALHNGKIVSPASYTLMTTPEGAAMTGALKYGFGLGRDTIAERTIITHGGGIHGFITGNAYVPSAQLSITVLTNGGRARSGELLDQLMRAALGLPFKAAAKR